MSSRLSAADRQPISDQRSRRLDPKPRRDLSCEITRFASNDVSDAPRSRASPNPTSPRSPNGPPSLGGSESEIPLAAVAPRRVSGGSRAGIRHPSNSPRLTSDRGDRPVLNAQYQRVSA